MSDFGFNRTGKTQTLTHQINFLIERGVESKRILALTFSNKTAEEMRERIAQIDEQVAAQISVMTFHAFGLDVLRAFWAEAELDPRSQIIDKIDALLYLEENLTALNLEHCQNLHEPTQNFAAVLGAISRAKDELCSPAEYRVFGEKMFADADSPAAVRVEIHNSLESEAANIVQHVEIYKERGANYKDCAVICRTHAQLDEFARVLSEKGVPVFYF